MADIKTKEFKSESRKALNNPQIQKSLVRVIDHFGEARVNAIQEITPEVWEILREKARTIKTHTMSYLDHYLDLMEANVRKNGGVMHFAKDAAEAQKELELNAEGFATSKAGKKYGRRRCKTCHHFILF